MLKNTVKRFNVLLQRLYAQKKIEAVLGDYVQRWLQWGQAALGEEITVPLPLYLTPTKVEASQRVVGGFFTVVSGCVFI